MQGYKVLEMYAQNLCKNLKNLGMIRSEPDRFPTARKALRGGADAQGSTTIYCGREIFVAGRS